MDKRVLGKTGMVVSPLGFGGSEIGFEAAGQSDVDRLLGSALDSGLNVIDTGECYMDSEEKIGKAISGRRSECLLFTKVGHSSGLEYPDWSVDLMRASIDRSLQRLQTETIDLMQLHTCGKDVLIQGDVIVELQRAREAGKVRFIGYSGDGEDAKCALDLGVFDTLQTSVNIADQECLTLTLPLAQRLGVGVIAKRPVANVAWRWGAEEPKEPYHIDYWERLKKLAYPFLSSGQAVSTALRFTLAQYVQTAIVGTKNPDRWAQNAAMLDEPLAASDIQAIRDRWCATATDDWVGKT